MTDKLEDSLLAEPPPFRSLLLSRSFLYLVCFASTHILRLNFVVGTFQLEVGALGFSSDDVAQHTTIFASMLPFGFIGMPLIGFALDKRPLSDVFLLVNNAFDSTLSRSSFRRGFADVPGRDRPTRPVPLLPKRETDWVPWERNNFTWQLDQLFPNRALTFAAFFERVFGNVKAFWMFSIICWWRSSW